MTEPGPREPDYPSGEQEGAPEQRTPQAPPPSEQQAAGTGGIGRVDDQTTTPPHGDEARGAAYDLGGDGRDEPQSPSGTQSPSGVGPVLVGTASWTDKTLLASGWYPKDADTPEKRLAYYAGRFPLVEVDSTYYAPPNERTAALWAARTPAGFTFNVKAFSLLTQHPTRPRALYADLRPDTAKNVYLKDLEPAAVDAVWERFLSALTPLDGAGKLGALLFQFPQWFPIGKRNKQYILECKQRCAPLRICVEFRNKTWLAEDNAAETLDFLTTYAVPYVCVDMPQGYPSSVPPVLAATADLAVVRFHGHSDKWESRDIYERFGYLYSEEELRGWVPKLRQLSEQARETHVLMNNCYRDFAQVNAQQLADLLHSV